MCGPAGRRRTGLASKGDAGKDHGLEPSLEAPSTDGSAASDPGPSGFGSASGAPVAFAASAPSSASLLLSDEEDLCRDTTYKDKYKNTYEHRYIYIYIDIYVFI